MNLSTLTPSSVLSIYIHLFFSHSTPFILSSTTNSTAISIHCQLSINILYTASRHDRALLLKLFEGKKIEKTYKTQQPVFIEKPCFNVTGFTQMESMIKWYEDNSDGLFSRFLVFCPVPVSSRWEDLRKPLPKGLEEGEFSLDDLFYSIWKFHADGKVIQCQSKRELITQC